MYINRISIKNFRLLKDSTLDLSEDSKQELSLLIGKNNSGKTSFIVIFDKFLRSEHYKFNFNDFPLSLRDDIINLHEKESIDHCSIQMKIHITYSEDDKLDNISDFILDLDPNIHCVKLLFECVINKEKLESDLSNLKDDKYKKKFIEKNLSEYLDSHIYVYNEEDDLIRENRCKLVEKTVSDVKRIINYQVIHAKRDLLSSEYAGVGKTALSELATNYINKDNIFSQDAFNSINDTILEMDEQLNKKYKEHFEEYFNHAKQFIDDGRGELNIVSDLESKQILSNYSKIVYGSNNEYLPENQNGLGHLNILFLLLQIEIKRKFFEQEKRDINLLFIEEPEAHTHPQMQYVFAQRIKEILNDIPNIQSFITTHSSHIISQCDFKDIKYFKIKNENMEIKNFYSELEKKYISEPEYFKFLKQYLTLYSSELFFAEKIIFIEGVSEKLLLPYFIKKYDEKRSCEEKYIPLTSQNISYLEAGANAKVFNHFIDFLGIKTLIITDLDGCKRGVNNHWEGCSTTEAINTTNVTIKHYLKAPELPKLKDIGKKAEELKIFNKWFLELKEHKISSYNSDIKIAYQSVENGYCGRSFEDAFISVNLKSIIENINEINGLENQSEITSDCRNFYNLTNKILKNDGKSDFASSILYLAFTQGVHWEAPQYITDGLNWIAE